MTQVTIFRYLAKYIASFIKIYGTLPMIEESRMRGHGSQWFSHKMNNRHPLQLKKIIILGDVLELPAK